MSDLLIPMASPPVLLRGEAIAAGLTDRTLARMVGRGELHRLRQGAYVAGSTWRHEDLSGRHRLLARAVVAQAKSPVVVSHGSAMALHGGPVYGLKLDRVEVTRLDGRACRREAGVRQHRGVLLVGDVATREGLPVTGATKTALDVTTVASVEAGLVVVNALLNSGRTTMAELQHRYSSMDRDPFTQRTDLVLRLADPRIESVGESRFFHLAWRHGLPAPEPQYEVVDAGHVVARLDFAWPQHGVWLEFDGREKYVKHLRDSETVTDAVLREKRREDRVRELTGWRCIRITWADLEDPERLAARVLAFLQ
ncbi:type IV toxin-antitoxin system AbiEi family antitoxin domain-containing protein [Nocardioides aestuarii]|uniref:Type IV toxin-antitoxin system AbiEi family antitoxin domain-containing protein n=1 Tax=Nocardioides aestuarii TaxID=252231 RepID=A0ABW4TNZ8_9ACTN